MAPGSGRVSCAVGCRLLWKGVALEVRYCSNCGNELEPDARFCWSCGRPVHRAARAPEADAPTSQLPTSPPPSPPQHQPRGTEARGGTAWHREAVAGGGISWPMLALAGVFLVLVVVETMQGGMSEAVRAVPLVAAVVLGASVVSYLSLVRRGGGATLRDAVFNWSVVVLAAFATFLFLIS